MSGIKKYTVNGMGMFDLGKGIAILAIVILHTQEIWDFSAFPVFNSVLDFIKKTIFCATNEAFFMMAGYNFRKRTNKKMLQMQWKQTIVPYYLAAVITIVLFFLVHFLFFHSAKDSIIETFRVGGGKLMGLSSTQDVFGFSFFSCGVGWFILALFWIEVVCNVVVNYVPEKWNFPIFFILFFVFSTLAKSPSNYSYFSFLAGLAKALFFYMGYLAKKEKLLDRDLRKPLLILLVLGLITYFIRTHTGENYSFITSDKESCMVSMINYSINRLISVCHTTSWAGFLALSCVCLSTANSKLVNSLSIIGRHSMDVFYVHMVEASVLPWYLLTNIFADRQFLGFGIHILARCTLIAFMCAGLTYYRFLKRDWKFKKEMKKENAVNA